MKADELWEKYSGNGYSVSKSDFLAALAEYGQAVRERDKEIARNYKDSDWLKEYPHGITAANNILAAISREPML